MRSLLRWLFNALSVLSLLLCGATMVLWVRSYWLSDRWHWSRHGGVGEGQGKIGWVDITTLGGRLGLHVETNSSYLNDYPLGWSHDVEETANSRPIEVERPQAYPFDGEKPFYKVYLNRGGFAYYREDFNPTYHDHYAILPLWFLLVVTAVPSLFAVRSFVARHRRRSRGISGLCPSCGYDLRASSRRCPECGRQISAGAKA